MASVADQLASNINFGAFAKATELKQRIWFALGCLIVYRLGTYIPLPGIDPQVMAQIFAQQAGGIMGMFNMFAGGALERMSIFALGILPYISASIIMQLMTAISPTRRAAEERRRGGPQEDQPVHPLPHRAAGHRARPMAWRSGSRSMSGPGGSAVIDPGWFFRVSTVITIVGGTMFLMWLGEQITARGIGNGISLIIFTGIIATLPGALASTLELGRTGAHLAAVHRPDPGAGPRRDHLHRLHGAGAAADHRPVPQASAGQQDVRRREFASAAEAQHLGRHPGDLRQFAAADAGDPRQLRRPGGPGVAAVVSALLGRGQPLFLLIFVSLIVFFAFFYTSIVFNPQETADNLKKHGGFIPGIRPGQRTADYLDYVLTRLTTVGALYLAAVCMMPEILISQYSVPFYFGGTSLLIVVAVTMDTVAQIQSHLIAHQYEGLIKKSRLRGRRS